MLSVVCMHYSPRNVLCCLTVSRFILAIAIDSYFLKSVPYIAQICFSKKKKKLGSSTYWIIRWLVYYDLTVVKHTRSLDEHQ